MRSNMKETLRGHPLLFFFFKFFPFDESRSSPFKYSFVNLSILSQLLVGEKCSLEIEKGKRSMGPLEKRLQDNVTPHFKGVDL